MLLLLNIAAAATVGLCTGIMYKYLIMDNDGKDNAAVPEEMTLYGNTGAMETLGRRIAAMADTVDARIGVALISSGGDTLVYYNTMARNKTSYFPLLSVFKFHQALAVCSWLGERGMSLDTEVDVSREMLPSGTWSPLRDSHPDGGLFSYRKLLEYTLGDSDNNACDILFSLTGGPEATDRYIRSIGLDGFRIECTEAMMHEDMNNCYRNCSTPLSAAILLEKFFGIRDSDEYLRFVWQTMSDCRTGQARIPGRISSSAPGIVHKTGTGDADPDGRVIAVNDIGIVLLPDSSHFSLAVFISDAACSVPQCEKIIADIALAAYED